MVRFDLGPLLLIQRRQDSVSGTCPEILLGPYLGHSRLNFLIPSVHILHKRTYLSHRNQVFQSLTPGVCRYMSTNSGHLVRSNYVYPPPPTPVGVHMLFLLFPASAVHRPMSAITQSFLLILRKSIRAIFTKFGMQDYWVSVLLGMLSYVSALFVTE